MIRRPPRSTLLSLHDALPICDVGERHGAADAALVGVEGDELTHHAASRSMRRRRGKSREDGASARSEEHTSELQSRQYLVCRLLLEKNNNIWCRDRTADAVHA